MAQETVRARRFGVIGRNGNLITAGKYVVLVTEIFFYNSVWECETGAHIFSYHIEPGATRRVFGTLRIRSAGRYFCAHSCSTVQPRSGSLLALRTSIYMKPCFITPQQCRQEVCEFCVMLASISSFDTRKIFLGLRPVQTHVFAFVTDGARRPCTAWPGCMGSGVHGDWFRGSRRTHCQAGEFRSLHMESVRGIRSEYLPDRDVHLLCVYPPSRLHSAHPCAFFLNVFFLSI